MLHITALLLSSWTLTPPPTQQQPRAIGRRDAVQFTLGAASAAAVGVPLPAFAARDPRVLKENVVAILRVKESAAQEMRLVQTGKYKDVQRSGIKRAVNFMIDNSNLRDRFVTAGSFAAVSDQQQANAYAGTAVESLVQILEYFPQDLVVNQLTPEQNSFVLRALTSTSDNIDRFLALMPAGAVESATAQIIEENELNTKEYQSEDGDNAVLNPVTLKDIK